MKSSIKTTKFLLVLFAIILGIVIVVNLFLPGTFPQMEGFQEGASSRPTVKQQVCDKSSCSKSFRAIDKWFEGKSVDDTKSFFNPTTGTLLSKPKYPFQIERKDNCSNYILCKSNTLVKETPSSDTVTETSQPPKESSSSSNEAKTALLQVQQVITDALGKV